MKRHAAFDKESKRVKFKTTAHTTELNDVYDDDFELELVNRKNKVMIDGVYSDNSGSEPSNSDFEDDDHGKKTKSKSDYINAEISTGKDIEGQEWNSTEFAEDGVKIDPFNMDQELEEGKFDDSGHYIREIDENRAHDTWMDGLTKTSIEKAKISYNRQEAREQFYARYISSEGKEDPNGLWIEILRLMIPGESVSDALRRFGKQKKLPAWKIKLDRKKVGRNSPKEVTLETSTGDESSVEKLTTLADELMSMGIYDVYEMKFEQIVRKLKLDEVLVENWKYGESLPVFKHRKPKSDIDAWEYKWKDEDELVHGPFTKDEMVSWLKSGNFDNHPLVVRKLSKSTPLDAFKEFVALESSPLIKQ